MRRSFRIIFSGVVIFLGWLLVRFITAEDLGDMELAYAYTEANLIPGSQIVEINTGVIWQPTAEPVKIAAGTQVRTDSQGTAQLVFADRSVLMIEPDTTITLAEHLVTQDETTIRIFQELGRTWSQVEKLLSPKSSYEVETHTTVATVRGTAFGVSVDEDQTVDYLVEEGQVEAQVVSRTGEQVQVLAKTMVNPNQTIHWQQLAAAPGVGGEAYAMIELAAESVETNQEMKTWRDRTRQKVTELSPVIKQVKTEIEDEHRQRLEELGRRQSLIRKIRTTLKNKLGLEQAAVKQAADQSVDQSEAGESQDSQESEPLPTEPQPTAEQPQASPLVTPLASPSLQVDDGQVRLLDQTVTSSPTPIDSEPTLLDQKFYLVQ